MHKNIQLCDDLSPEYLREITTFLAEWENEKPYINVSTSGSTGIPKQLQLNKQNVKASAIATGKFFNFKKGQKIILNLSPNYIAGKLIIVRALVHDMDLLVLPTSKNPLLSLKKNTKIDFAAFVPYQVEAILKNPNTAKIYTQCRNVIIGGAPIPYYLEQELQHLSNGNYATFGMTETITHFALRNISKKEVAFKCLPGFSIEKNHKDCLVINENKITKRLVATDVIEVVNSSEFIWKGRADFTVNSAGIKLHPEVIERKIAPFLTDRRFYCSGVPSEKFGQELVLIIEGEPIGELDKLKIQVFQNLTVFEKPKRILFFNTFKETVTGKVIRLKPAAFYNDTSTELGHN